MQPSEDDLAWFQSTFRPIPKPVLPEDCIEYHLHLISQALDTGNDSELRLKLREVQKHANELQKQWLKGYIWQRQGFSCELVKEDGEVGIKFEGLMKQSNRVLGVSLLTGRTGYGDSVEDEWVVVWLLRELTRKFDNLWIKVSDSDGEFLLIEASGTIPAWLEPEVAENRVWIHDGQLKIIKPANIGRSSKRTNEKITLQEARQIILTEPKKILHSQIIEEEAFYRLRNYPGQIEDNMHHALARLPRKVAFLLLQKPSYIAPAIEAFYLRDPIALKPLQNAAEDGLYFPARDLVTLSVKFPKVGYAQVRSQEFPILGMWKKEFSGETDTRKRTYLDTGFKVASGFEMLLSDPQNQDKQVVREMKMILEDLETGDDTLPSDEQIATLGGREDDEKWLDISLEDLEHELGGKEHAARGGKQPEFGDRAAQENLQRIVKQFETFLNDKEESDTDDSSDDDADPDHEIDSDSGEDKDASFDEEEFTKMMQEMMGLPSDVMEEIMSGDLDALKAGGSSRVAPEIRERALAKVQEIHSSDEDVDDEIQMERELQASGVLSLNPTNTEGKTSGKVTVAGQVMDQRDTKGFQDKGGSNDFDIDFARNILRSFQSSGGKGGPAANLMNMMGSSAGESSKRKGQK